jgi:hypothetical protein
LLIRGRNWRPWLRDPLPLAVTSSTPPVACSCAGGRIAAAASRLLPLPTCEGARRIKLSKHRTSSKSKSSYKHYAHHASRRKDTPRRGCAKELPPLEGCTWWRRSPSRQTPAEP